MLHSPSRLTYELLLLYHIDKYVDFLSSYLSLYNLCYFCHYKKAPKRKVGINPFVQITLSTLSINGNTQLHFSL